MERRSRKISYSAFRDENEQDTNSSRLIFSGPKMELPLDNSAEMRNIDQPLQEQMRELESEALGGLHQNRVILCGPKLPPDEGQDRLWYIDGPSETEKLSSSYSGKENKGFGNTVYNVASLHSSFTDFRRSFGKLSSVSTLSASQPQKISGFASSTGAQHPVENQFGNRLLHSKSIFSSDSKMISNSVSSPNKRSQHASESNDAKIRHEPFKSEYQRTADASIFFSGIFPSKNECSRLRNTSEPNFASTDACSSIALKGSSGYSMKGALPGMALAVASRPPVIGVDKFGLPASVSLDSEATSNIASLSIRMPLPALTSQNFASPEVQEHSSKLCTNQLKNDEEEYENKPAPVGHLVNMAAAEASGRLQAPIMGGGEGAGEEPAKRRPFEFISSIFKRRKDPEEEVEEHEGQQVLRCRAAGVAWWQYDVGRRVAGSQASLIDVEEPLTGSDHLEEDRAQLVVPLGENGTSHPNSHTAYIILPPGNTCCPAPQHLLPCTSTPAALHLNTCCPHLNTCCTILQKQLYIFIVFKESP
ncbi:hypothetical protein FHG87_016552 [Trinorchestia longiramus]|nr:hypothetical protein FHG87_016552 [Trinorchestia longiramus]